MSMTSQDVADRLKKRSTGPITEAEVEFLHDLQAFIDFSIRNGLSFFTVAGNIARDINELGRDGFDYESAQKRGFQPKVAGFSKLTAESFDAETLD